MKDKKMNMFSTTFKKTTLSSRGTQTHTHGLSNHTFPDCQTRTLLAFYTDVAMTTVYIYTCG